MNSIILVVENDADLRELLITVLDDEGYTPHGVENQEKALKLLASISVDLIIVDMELEPLLDNPFLERLFEAASQIPVIAICEVGFEAPEHYFNLKTLIAKPFDLGNLMANIRLIAA